MSTPIETAPILVDVPDDRDASYEEFLRTTNTPILPEQNEAVATKGQVDLIINQLDCMLMRYENSTKCGKKRNAEMFSMMLALLDMMRDIERGQTAIIKRLNLLESQAPAKRFETEIMDDSEEETSEPLIKKRKLD